MISERQRERMNVWWGTAEWGSWEVRGPENACKEFPLFQVDIEGGDGWGEGHSHIERWSKLLVEQWGTRWMEVEVDRMIIMNSIWGCFPTEWIQRASELIHVFLIAGAATPSACSRASSLFNCWSYKWPYQKRSAVVFLGEDFIVLLMWLRRGVTDPVSRPHSINRTGFAQRTVQR